MSVTRIEGNLGNDPEIKSTEKSNFTVLSVAKNRSRFNKENKTWESLEPDWFTVVCFGSLSERAKLLKKGDEVVIDARLSPVTKDINGTKVKTINLSARKIQKIAHLKGTSQIDDGLPDFHSDEEIPF